MEAAAAIVAAADLVAEVIAEAASAADLAVAVSIEALTALVAPEDPIGVGDADGVGAGAPDFGAVDFSRSPCSRSC